MKGFSHHIRLSLALACIAVGTSANAQSTIYKQVLPDGRVIYTDKPDPRIATEKTLKPEFRTHGISLRSSAAERARHGGARQPSSSPSALPPSSLNPGLPGTALKASAFSSLDGSQPPHLPPLPGASVSDDAPLTMQQTQDFVESEARRLQDIYAKERKIRLEQATQRYERAVKNQTDGLAALGGERNPGVNGAARVNERYHARQKQLNDEVQQARQALESVRKE